MSDRDRSNQDRGINQPTRRDSQPGERSSGAPRSRPFDEDEVFDLPTWNEPAPRGSRADTGNRSSASRRAPEPEPRSSSRREPIPELGDAVRRTSRRSSDAQDQAAPGSQEPYDRLRGVASRPQRAVEFDEEPYEDYGYDEEYAPYPQQSGSRSRRGTSRVARGSTSQRTPTSQQIGGLLASTAPQTRFIAMVMGIGLLSLVFMAATVAGRMSSLPEWIPIHLNAEGSPDRWGTRSTLWRIPLMLFFTSLMSIAIAWSVGKRDAFAVRFALGSTLLIHALCWIALINLAW